MHPLPSPVLWLLNQFPPKQCRPPGQSPGDPMSLRGGCLFQLEALQHPESQGKCPSQCWGPAPEMGTPCWCWGKAVSLQGQIPAEGEGRTQNAFSTGKGTTMSILFLCFLECVTENGVNWLGGARKGREESWIQIFPAAGFIDFCVSPAAPCMPFCRSPLSLLPDVLAAFPRNLQLLRG